MRNNTCFYQDSAHWRVTKGRTVQAKWTAIYFVHSTTDECKYRLIYPICIYKTTRR